MGEQLVVLDTANNLSLGVVFFLLIRTKTFVSKDMFLKKELLQNYKVEVKIMEKIERDLRKWTYTKAAAYSGTIGLIVGIVYTVYNFIRLGVTELLGGFIGGTVGQFFLIILGFVIVGVILFAIYKALKK